MFKVKIRKVGNSFGIILNKTILKLANFETVKELFIQVIDGKIVLTKKD